MGTLTDYYKTERNRKAAADLIGTVTSLLAQETSNNAALQTLKNKIKTDIAADTYNKQDIINIGQMLTLKDGITNQKANYKTQLTTLKGLVNDATYEAEIQTEIDKL